MTTRRSFLKSMLEACMAPAIVRADSLMKIYVPPAPKIMTFDGTGDFLEAPSVFDTDMPGDFTMESWVQPQAAGVWRHFACVSRVNDFGEKVREEYVDGELVAQGTQKLLAPELSMDYKNGVFSIASTEATQFAGMLDDVRITKGVARGIVANPEYAKSLQGIQKGNNWFHVSLAREVAPVGLGSDPLVDSLKSMKFKA